MEEKQQNKETYAGNAYSKIHCKCKQQLRPKEQTDWLKGEKNKTGYYPNIGNYYYCDGCKRTWIENNKETK